MTRIRLNGLPLTAAITLGLLAAACSSEPLETSSSTAESADPVLDAVPDDATEFQAVATVDASGYTSNRRVLLEGGRRFEGVNPEYLAAVHKEPELVEAPPKISRSLSDKLKVSTPGELTEIVVSVSHDFPFSTLPRLKRDEPRSSTENQRRFVERAAVIAEVERLREPSRAAIAARARALGGEIIEEFTLGNSLALKIPSSAVELLALEPTVLGISPNNDASPPPPSMISDGATLEFGMNTDAWRSWSDGSFTGFFVGLLDTGVRSTHTVFGSPDGGALGVHRDCYNTTHTSCLNIPINASYNDQDTVWNHGTPSANIIMGGNSSSPGFGINYRGISRATLDYFNVYEPAGANYTAFKRAMTVARNMGDDLIIAEVQFQTGENGAEALAADEAFDLGIAVIGASGNVSQVDATASPGLAHKALSIANNLGTGSRSGVVGGRIKPDIQGFPGYSSVETASNASNTGKTIYNGTSAATAFVGGAAALMYEWYNLAWGITNRPGNLYTGLLAQGDAVGQPTTPNGAGQLKLVGCSQWYTGQFTMGTATFDVPLAIPAGKKDMKVAIWWPESVTQAHNDVDLFVISPSQNLIGSSQSGGSVFEKVKHVGNLAAGSYTMRFYPYSMPRPTQVMYYTAIVSCQ